MLIRVSGASVALLVAARVVGGPKIKGGRDWAWVALLGLLGVTANQTFFLMGLSRTTAVNASILVTTIPVFTVLYSLLGRQERASPFKLMGIALAAAGTVYLIGPDRVSLRPDLALGNGLVVMGMMCYAGFLVLSKPLLRRYGTVAVSANAMAFGAIGTVPFGLLSLSHTDLTAVSPVTWWWVLYIVVVPTVGAYFLNAWALNRTSSQLVAAFIYLQPVFTVIVAPLVLAGEDLSHRALLGGVAIFLGLGLVIWGERRRVEGVPPPIAGE